MPSVRTHLCLAAACASAFLLATCRADHPPQMKDEQDSPEVAHFDHAPWYGILSRCVRDGRVDYEAARAEGRALDAYLRNLASADPAGFASEADRLLFWANAYNACVLKGVLDTLPDDPERAKSYETRRVPGFFTQRVYLVAGRTRTLDQIEKEELGKQAADPRVHLVLVCGARGCPPLRPPEAGASLDAWLDDSVRLFLRNPANLRIDRGTRTVYLSRIFEWNKAEFDQRYGSVLGFLVRYASTVEDRNFLAGAGLEIRYVDYDWSLNR